MPPSSTWIQKGYQRAPADLSGGSGLTVCLCLRLSHPQGKPCSFVHSCGTHHGHDCGARTHTDTRIKHGPLPHRTSGCSELDVGTHGKLIKNNFEKKKKKKKNDFVLIKVRGSQRSSDCGLHLLILILFKLQMETFKNYIFVNS